MKQPRYLNTLRGEANFVPAWYVERRRRRRAHRRQIAMLIVVAIGMALLVADAERTRARLKSHDAVMRDQLGVTHRVLARAERLRDEHAQRARKLDLHRRLHQPIGYSQVVATLASLTPPSIALRSLDMRNERITVRRRAGDNGDPPQGARRARNTPAATRPVISIELEGIAPSDVEVANLIGALSSSDLFEDVELLYARQGTQGDLLTRVFEVRMQIPLDRTYRPTQPPEVADAQ